MDIKPIPEGFLSRLLNEFGIQWTHLVVLSGVVFSSFGLQTYVDAGVWILGTVGAFGLVYLFRYRISGDFLKTSIWSFIALTGGILIGWGLLYLTNQTVGQFMQNRIRLSTLYISVVIGVPLGIMILSYRSQDELLRSPLPPALAAAAKNLSQMDFVHEEVSYIISFLPPTTGDVIMRFEVTMDLVNRSTRTALYRDSFDPAGRNKHFVRATINGSPVNEADWDRLTQRGLRLEHEAAPGEKFRVVVIGESTFYSRDNELVGVYLPCNTLSIRIMKPPDELSVHIESLLPKKVDAERLPTGDLLFQYSGGVLPFQGTRIFWEPRS